MSKEVCPLRDICLEAWKDDIGLDQTCEMRQTTLMKVTREFIKNKIFDFKESLRGKERLDRKNGLM